MRAGTGLLLAAVALSLPVRGVAQQDNVSRPGDGVVTPKVLKEVKPDYTPEARIAGVEGSSRSSVSSGRMAVPGTSP